METITMHDKPALVLIALQKGFDEVEYWGGHRNNPDAERNAKKLLEVWREKELPLFHVQHLPVEVESPLREGKEGHHFKEEVSPKKGETIIRQNVYSAFAGEELRKKLEEAKIKKLVVIGMSTDRCVSSVVRMASIYGYDAFVVYDATATFNKPNPRIDEQMYSAELIHDTALASLKGEFASVVMTDEVINALCKN